MDDATDELIRNSVLDAELLGPVPTPSDSLPTTGPEEPPGPRGPNAAELLHLRSVVKTWSDGITSGFEVHSEAAAARESQVPGGPYTPFEISIVLRGKAVSFVHWSCNKTLVGRRCNLDSSNKIVWPTACNSTEFPKESWVDATILHPTTGARARRNRILREPVRAALLNLKRMAELSAMTPDDLTISYPPMGRCFICHRGDLTPAQRPIDIVYPPDIADQSHARDWHVRQCALCLQELHFACSERAIGHHFEALVEHTQRPEPDSVFEDTHTELIPKKPDIELPSWSTRSAVTCWCNFCLTWYHTHFPDTDFGGA